MHTSWQWSVTPFQGFASPVATSKCHCLATQKGGPREPSLLCFVLGFWVFLGGGVVLFCFLKQQNQSPGPLVAKQLWEKQVEAATKQQ